MARTWNTDLGPLDTELRSFGDLEIGDVVVGENLRSVHKVTADVTRTSFLAKGALGVRNLTPKPGEDPDELWTYHPDTPMHYVVGGLPAGVDGR
ncbi:hypothetical protein [Micromonospora sp. NPDC005652]|uniref:hypothetical protein n=1 Tax=Micromonospora sp. NPDC005652 TaxID=3157046 RepID=UPI00340A4920